jgi:hypothetical protein
MLIDFFDPVLCNLLEDDFSEVYNASNNRTCLSFKFTGSYIDIKFQ